MAGAAFQFSGDFNQFADLFVSFDDLSQIRILFYRVVNRNISPAHRRRDHLWDPFDLGVWHFKGASFRLDHPPRSHSSERDDLRDVLPAVQVAHVVDDVRPPAHAEVNINVWHSYAFRVQETLEE